MARYWGADKPKGDPKDVRAKLVFTAMEAGDVERELEAADEVARIWRLYQADKGQGGKYLGALFAALDALAKVAPKDES